MSRTSAIYRTTFPGGLISVDSLRAIAELSMARGDGTLTLSSCQQLEVILEDTTEASALPALAMLEGEEAVSNVPMSTVGMVELSRSREWLSLGAFQEMLEEIPRTRNFTVGVSDSAQSLFPVYTGDVTLLADSVPYYWNVALRERDGTIAYLPCAIPSVSIPDFLRALDIKAGRYGMLSREWVDDFVDSKFRHVVIPAKDAPQKCADKGEGMVGIQPMPSGGRSSLSIYPEWGTVSAQFLLELCLLARSEQIGLVFLTPYRSLLVPNISSENIPRWRRLIGRFQLSMYPPEITSLCLVGDDQEARALAKRVLSVLVWERCHASGLSMSFLNPEARGEAMIRIKRSRRRFGWLQPMIPRYDLYCHKGFEESCGDLRPIHTGLSVPRLIEELKRLVLKYNIDGVQWEQFEKRTRVEALPPITACSSCGTRYDAEYGDPAGGIEPGIGFDDLPDTWLCPVCDSPKTFYARREQDRHEELSA